MSFPREFQISVVIILNGDGWGWSLEIIIAVFTVHINLFTKIYLLIMTDGITWHKIASEVGQDCKIRIWLVHISQIGTSPTTQLHIAYLVHTIFADRWAHVCDIGDIISQRKYLHKGKNIGEIMAEKSVVVDIVYCGGWGY